YGSYYYHPWGWGYFSGPPPSRPPEPDALHLVGAFGADFQSHFVDTAAPTGWTGGLNLALEGERFGFNTRFDGIFAASQEGTDNVDRILLWRAHLTYAVFANEHARVRIEGGVASAFAPDLATAGPSIGASAVVGLVGPIGLEGSIQATPFPFMQVDA